MFPMLGCLVTMHLSAAGEKGWDCSLHVADAVAVDRLLRALPTQSQLETVEIAIEGIVYDGEDHPISMEEGDDDVETEIDADAAEVVDMYRQMSAITAKMFHPAWASVCRLLEDGRMTRLRYNMAGNRQK